MPYSTGKKFSLVMGLQQETLNVILAMTYYNIGVRQPWLT